MTEPTMTCEGPLPQADPELLRQLEEQRKKDFVNEQTISILELNKPEQAVLLACLELSKNRISKADEERIQHTEAMRQIMNGNKVVRKHAKHEVFSICEVIEYYADHDLDEKKRIEIEKFAAVCEDAVFVTVEKIIEKVSTAEPWNQLTSKAINQEMDYAAQRLAVHGLVRLFPGTPRFSANSISPNLEKIEASIRSLDRQSIQPTAHATPNKGKLHTTVPGDEPYEGDDDLSEIENEILESVQYATEPYNDLRKIESLDDLSPEQRIIIQTATEEANSRVTIHMVIDRIKKHSALIHYKPRTLYMRLYRAAHDLQAFGFAQLKKDGENYSNLAIDGKNNPRLRTDGFLWIQINREKIHKLICKDAETLRSGTAGKDLIEGYCEIPTDVIEPKKQPRQHKKDIYAMPKNVNGPRKAAIRYLMGVKMLDWKENEQDRLHKRKGRGPYHDARFLIDLFRLYSDDTLRKIIVLMNNLTGETLGSDYSTRFNDFQKGIDKLRSYEYAHDKSLVDYSKAVFLTLTTDPKRFPSLWHANRHMGEAFNQFVQNLTNKLGKRSKRLKYMAAAEYTKTGLLHLHILIFDRTHLFSADGEVEQAMISKIWSNCGQGEIVKAYGLKNTELEGGKREWRWYGREQPKDAKGMNGGDYLKKYLKKCMLAIIDNYNEPANTLFPYWAFNKRFFTCSRSFLPPKETIAPTIEEQKKSLFSIHFISYDITLDEARNAGMVDRVAYRRWIPKDKDGPPADGYMPEVLPQ